MTQVEDIYPLSPLQQGLLFHARLEADGTVYRWQVSCRIDGPLDLQALRWAFERVVRRHAALRSSFAWEGLDQPVQVIDAEVDLPLEEHDWSGLSEAARQECLEELLAADFARPFHLDRAPLFRLYVIREGEDRHRLVWSKHLLILDGWSTSRVIGEVLAAHDALRRGAEPDLPPVHPYRDYIAWLVRCDGGAEAERFWRTELAGFAVPTPLPGAVGRKGGGGVPVRRGAALPPALTAELLQTARRFDLTQATVVQGLWALLLSRVSGEEDVVFGATVSGRPPDLPGAEEMIGPLTNTLPVRACCRGGSLAGWLAALQVRQAEARSFHGTPLVQIQRWSEVPPGTPLFESLVVFENYPVASREGSGLKLSELRVVEMSHYPLALTVFPGDALDLHLAYDPVRLDAAAAARVLCHLEILFAAFARGPERPVGELEMLSPAERHQVLVEWADGGPAASPLAPVHTRVAEQAARTPSAPALVHEGEILTYSELRCRAGALARHLRRAGVGREDRVALWLERSPDVPVAMLGIWEAGAAFVPLDPDHPELRVAVMLEDCAPAAVITRSRLAPGLPAAAPSRVILLEEVEMDALPETAAPVPLAAAAYVLYTSGSTGTPKGVVVEHRHLASTLLGSHRELGWHDGDVVPCLAPFTFDISLFELLVPLLAGGTVHLVGLKPTLDVPGLARSLGRFTRLHAVPAVMRQIVDTLRAGGAAEGPSSLRTLLVGGDVVPPELLVELRQVFPRAEIRILYGPTEGTIICSSYRVPSGDGPPLPLVGRPLPGALLALRNADGRPVPIGAPGEIWIGGSGVSRGYLGRPELTAERFPVLDGERFYRSGDLARQRPDGCFEFLGRGDDQVKIRGIRVEPGEVEAALTRHPDVAAAVVAALADGEGERRLVAWVVGRSVAPLAAALREHLRGLLPEAMVPSVFTPIPELPLTAHGKVDRHRLPAPVAEAAPSGPAARGPVEETVADIWAQILERGGVGAHDDFFALGGHSLLATRVISRVREVFEVEVPLSSLFETPTVAGLAAAVDDLLRAGRGLDRPPLVARTRSADPPLSFAQERLWVVERLLPGRATYNVPAAARLSGPLVPAALAASIDAVVARHEVLRTSLVDEGGGPVQRIHPSSGSAPGNGTATAPPRLPLVDLSGLPSGLRGPAAQTLAAREARQPFDLARGPLLRCLLLRQEAREHLLCLTLHHTICDAWSIGVLIRELSILYPAVVAGGDKGAGAGLPPLPIQYADFALWQREWLRGEALEALLTPWRERLAGLADPTGFELSADRTRPALPDPRGGIHRFNVPAVLADSVRIASRRAGATLFMFVLAGLQALVHRLTGARDLALGSPVANRNRAEIEPLIGFFVNTLVLRARPAPELPFADLLARARRESVAAFVHQDLPFERLVEELRPERSLGRQPLFQILFALQTAPLPELALGPLQLQPCDIEQGVAKLDLVLVLADSGGPLTGSLEYRRDLFDRTTVARLAVHLEILLGAAARDVERPLADLPLFGAAERHQILAEWNDTAGGPSGSPFLHELFAAQARHAPQAEALAWEGGGMTYAELADRAGRLALGLRRLGVGPEVAVAVEAERTPETWVAALAVLASGGIWVPLDPAWPRQRLALVLEDVRASVVLLQGEALAGLAPGARELRTPWDAELGGAAEPAVGARPCLWPESPAYVIYTSGSTGRPKGVVSTHRALAALAVAQAAMFGTGPGSRVLQFSSPSFDASISELAMTLAGGGTLCVAAREALLPGPELLQTLQGLEITTVTLPPSILAALPAAALPELSTLVTAGEACPPPLGAMWASGRRLLNAYGPAEATVCATIASAAAVAERITAGSMPLGRPLPGVDVHVLDESLRPVPAGVPGEICLSGLGLARGYLGAAERTAERFIPNPFAQRPGERLYRTGDLGCRSPDGGLEYLGRTDRQVKIRGVRIEPGEVEAALARQPGVREAAVELLSESGGEPRLAAFVVPTGHPLDGSALRGALAAELPASHVPASLFVLPSLPLTPSGKMDRAALRRYRPDETPFTAPHTRFEETVAGIWSEVLSGKLGRGDRIGRDDSFFDLGGNSLLLLRVQARLRRELGREVAVLDLFRYPTVSRLAAFLASDGGADGEVAPAGLGMVSHSGPRERAVAVVGLAGRFPGASDLDAYWRNLRAGIVSIARFSRDELAAEGVPEVLLDDPAWVPARGALDGAEELDAAFFGLSAREAEITDPQHRIFLECAWEVLENAGYDPAPFSGRIGVFASSSLHPAWLERLSHQEQGGAAGFHLVIHNDKDFLPTRISYKLNLRGPSVAVQTACSSSLVAVHLACRSLLDGECDLALAGGVSVLLPQRSGYLYQEGGISSPDGRCRAYEARAQGTVAGSGAGIVVLKRLGEALADGDRIDAVILGSAVNNDGGVKIGYAAPAIDGQADVVRAALATAGVEASTVGFVEGHGTGTAVGDPIEVAALTQAFRASTAERGFCALGSVKSNIGHLDAAAGVAGLIKAVLALKHGEIPPQPELEATHPAIDFEASPFRVPAAPFPWPRTGPPRRAGVSSFGIGGTNAHVILEEAPQGLTAYGGATGPARSHQLLVLSARSEAALEAAASRLAVHLETRPDLPLADLAFTLQTGRRAFEHRRVVVCRDAAEAVRGLRDSAARGSSVASSEVGGAGGVALLFPGQGVQHPGMGRELYEGEPCFRAEVDRAASILEPWLGLDLRRVLFPAAGEEARAAAALRRTDLGQPALFVVEWALARLWMEWGLQPAAVLGHSVGELAAACLAGVFDLPAALALVAARGRLMQDLPPGAMLSVPTAEKELLPLLGRDLDLAAVNGPAQCVVAGPEEAVARLEQELARRGTPSRRLETSHAFHSRAMIPAAEPFRREVDRASARPPRLPFVSSLTGGWVGEGDLCEPSYWARQLLSPVRFGAAAETLLGGPAWPVLEVGPGRSLGSAVARQPAARSRLVLSSLPGSRGGASATETLLTALGRLWSEGAAVDWKGFHAHEKRRRVEAPTYPFERRRYTLPAPPPAANPAFRLALGAVPSRPVRRPLGHWFAVPSWRRTPPVHLLAPSPAAGPAAVWVVAGEAGGLAPALLAEARRRGIHAIQTRSGESFRGLDGDEATVRRGETVDWDDLLAALPCGAPLTVISLEALEAVSGADGGALLAGLLPLARALARRTPAGPMRLVVGTAGLFSLQGEPWGPAGAATLLGPCRCFRFEVPDAEARLVDLPLQDWGADPDAAHDAAAWLAGEAAAESTDTVVAWRGGARWAEAFEPLHLRGGELLLREAGVYLISGGLGGVGFAVARHLAAACRARLVLLGRSVPGVQDPRLRELESAGAEVLAVGVDVAEEVHLREAVDLARSRFGRIDGVVHAAGVQSSGLLHAKTLDLAAGVLAPKVGGALSLAAALRDERLDFFAFFSSLRAVVGGAGESDYCAANAFLGAFATRLAAEGVPAVAIDWDTWRGVGMAAGSEAPGMTVEEGIEALRRAVASGMPQVLVSTEDLDAVLARARSFSAATELARLESRRPPTAQRRPQGPPCTSPGSERELALAAIWQELLGVEPVGIHDDFFELGGDSVVSLQMIARAARVGIALTPRQIFEHPTIGELAALGGAAEVFPAEPQKPVSGPLPLTPIQRWFFAAAPPALEHWNQSILLWLPPDLAGSTVEAAVVLLVEHHDALRLRFSCIGGSWTQDNGPWPTAVPYLEVDLAAIPAERFVKALSAAAAQAQTGLPLATGPLLRAVRFAAGAGRAGRLLLVVHHLATDAVSWRILLEDLDSACRRLAAGERPELPPRTTSFQRWAELLLDHAGSETLARELPFWRSEAGRWAAPLPLDGTEGENTERGVLQLELAFSEKETRAFLHEAPAVLQAGGREILLAALALALSRWVGDRRLRIDLEGHGREPLSDGIDLSRTVGWFSTLYPLFLDLSGVRGPTQTLEAVHRALRQIPGRGLGYGLLRWVAGAPELAAGCEAEVLFLYLGGQDRTLPGESLLREAPEPPGPMRDPRAPRRYLLEVSAAIADGTLCSVWTYNEARHRRASIEAVAAEFATALRELLAVRPAAEDAAPFGQVSLSPDELDDLMAELSGAED